MFGSKYTAGRRGKLQLLMEPVEVVGFSAVSRETGTFCYTPNAVLRVSRLLKLPPSSASKTS